MEWTVDASHSSLDFAVKHMGISTVRGRFRKFAAAIEHGEQHVLRGVTVTIEASSVDTGEPKRDEHLRSADFLDAEHYPQLRFASTSVTAQGGGRYLVAGDLTIRDQSHAASFEVEIAPPMTDPWGNLRSAATGRGTLNRKAWGLTYNMPLALGGWVVGEDVQFTFDLEAVAKAPVAVR